MTQRSPLVRSYDWWLIRRRLSSADFILWNWNQGGTINGQINQLHAGRAHESSP
jgi:hypothetical protein